MRRTASDDPATEDQLSLDLASTANAPGLARGAAAGAVQRWRFPCLADVVVLVVSELVTNAVRYGLPPVRLVLSRRARGLRVEVHDQASGAPLMTGAAGEADESGRGMAIVQAVASDAGVEQTAEGGKAVYAVFDLPGDRR